jgi:hypothetical protein
MEWFQKYRRANHLYLPGQEKDDYDCILLSMVNKEKLSFLFNKILDESEFLSGGGIRALSKFYEKNPYTLNYGGNSYSIQYDPGDSTSDMFGGNSNWRGPVWMPVNFLLINAIKIFGSFYQDDLKIECPTGSGKLLPLTEVAKEITRRLLHIFEKNDQNERPVNGPYNWFYKKEENKDLVLFHEYFHGDTLRGLGASHQTGWTGLIANLILDLKEDNEK